MASWFDGWGDSIGSGLNYIGGLFGGSETPAASPTTPVVPPSKTNSGGGLFSDSKFLGSVLNAGLGLAGKYMEQSQNKSLAEQYAAQKKAQLDAAAALAAKGGGGGGGGGGGPDRAAQMSQLYANWAALRQREGESEAAAAAAAGRLSTDPIIARLGRL